MRGKRKEERTSLSSSSSRRPTGGRGSKGRRGGRRRTMAIHHDLSCRLHLPLPSSLAERKAREKGSWKEASLTDSSASLIFLLRITVIIIRDCASSLRSRCLSRHKHRGRSSSSSSSSSFSLPSISIPGLLPLSHPCFLLPGFIIFFPLSPLPPAPDVRPTVPGSPPPPS